MDRAGPGGETGLWRAFFFFGGGGFLLLLLLFSSQGLCRDVPPKDTSPSCHTDFATELVCCWRGDPSANCTEAFQLHYKTDAARNSQACLLENKRSPGSGPWCTCVIPGRVSRHVQYHLELYRNTARGRTVVWQDTREAENMAVKPRPLVNLTVAKRSHSFLLTWEKDYAASNRIYNAKAKYEVAYWPQSQEGKLARCSGNDQVCCSHHCRILDTEPPCIAKKQEVSELSSDYEIYADQLAPHLNYMASVRYRLELWETVWSEWSSPCAWHNDLEFGDGRWKSLPWVCVPVVAAILTCYLCLGRVKKWQDSIPHPVVMMGEQVSCPSFPKKETHPFPFGVKTLLCDLCNRTGPEPPGGCPLAPASGLATQEKVPRNPPRAHQEQILRPEIPLIEPSPVICSCETMGIGPPAQQEEMQERLRLPHAHAVASLFSNAVSDGLSLGDVAGLGLWPEDQGAPSCPPESSLENAPWAPRLLPGGPHAVQGGGATAEASSEPGSPTSSTATTSPEHRLKRSGPCPDEQAGGIHPTPDGYKSFSSLSQPTALFCLAWEEQTRLAGGNQLQLAGNRPEPRLPWGPRLCGLQSRFPGGRDSLWLFPGQVAAATPLVAAPPQGDSCRDDPGEPGTPSCPDALPSPGYRSLASLLPKGSEGTVPGSLGLEPPYKPLPSVLRSWPTEHPPPEGGLLLGLGPGDKVAGIATWPGVVWDAPLAFSQQLESMDGDFPGASKAL